MRTTDRCPVAIWNSMTTGTATEATTEIYNWRTIDTVMIKAKMDLLVKDQFILVMKTKEVSRQITEEIADREADHLIEENDKEVDRPMVSEEIVLLTAIKGTLHTMIAEIVKEGPQIEAGAHHRMAVVTIEAVCRGYPTKKTSEQQEKVNEIQTRGM